MNFGQAIEALKEGKKVARKAGTAKECSFGSNPLPPSRPSGAKTPCSEQSRRKTVVRFLRSVPFCMFTAQREILSGWLASQTDMLSEDWEEVTGVIISICRFHP